MLPNFGIHISMGGEMGPNGDSSGGDIDKGDEGVRKDAIRNTLKIYFRFSGGVVSV